MPTLRQEAGQAKAILFGTLANPRLPASGNGITDLYVEMVLREHPLIKDKKVIELPRYVPVSDPKDPPHFLIFCDVFQSKLDPYRGIPVKSAALVDYVKGSLALDPKDRVQCLLYFFRYLEHPDPEVAQDAFLEFAKANDQEIGQVAGKLAAAKIRGWVKDARLPANRLSLYAFLLGACGTPEDAPLLRSLLDDSSERTTAAFDGLLAGYIQLSPRDGWDLAFQALRDPQKPFPLRLAVVRALRFFHGWRPEENKARILQGLDLVLARADMADMAVEDLRRWQVWDLTPSVLPLYRRQGYDAPLMRRAIVRYALACPRPEAVRLVAEVRRQDPQTVKDVEESLRYEQSTAR
jgi:hypothetical protein